MNTKVIGPLTVLGTLGGARVLAKGPNAWFCLPTMRLLFHVPRGSRLRFWVEVQSEQLGSNNVAVYVYRHEGGRWTWGIDPERTGRALTWRASDWLTRNLGGPSGEVQKIYVRLLYEEMD